MGDLGTHFFSVWDAVTVNFTFTAAAVALDRPDPVVEWVVKGNWRYTGILGDRWSEEPFSRGYTFGEKHNFYDRWGPMFPVPEASTYAMLGLGLAIVAFGAIGRRQRVKQVADWKQTNNIT